MLPQVVDDEGVVLMPAMAVKTETPPKTMTYRTKDSTIEVHCPIQRYLSIRQVKKACLQQTMVDDKDKGSALGPDKTLCDYLSSLLRMFQIRYLRV